MKRDIFLEGEKLYLRLLRVADIDTGNYGDWFNDAETCYYNEHHRFPYSRKQLEEYIESAERESSKIVFAIIDKEKEIHVGNIAIQNIDFINRSAELAFIIGEKEYLNRGFSTEAAKLCINHAFMSLNLRRLYCGTLKDNIAMNKLAKKLGFFEEGIRKEAVYKNGKYCDVVEYGIIREQ